MSTYPIDEIFERSFGIEWKYGNEGRPGAVVVSGRCHAVDKIYIQDGINVGMLQGGKQIDQGRACGISVAAADVTAVVRARRSAA